MGCYRGSLTGDKHRRRRLAFDEHALNTPLGNGSLPAMQHRRCEGYPRREIPRRLIEIEEELHDDKQSDQNPCGSNSGCRAGIRGCGACKCRRQHRYRYRRPGWPRRSPALVLLSPGCLRRLQWTSGRGWNSWSATAIGTPTIGGATENGAMVAGAIADTNPHGGCHGSLQREPCKPARANSRLRFSAPGAGTDVPSVEAVSGSCRPCR